MLKSEKLEIERLLTLESATMEDKRSAVKLYVKYIYQYNGICITCPGSVRHMFKRIRYWWDKQNKKNYTFIKKIQ